MKLQTGVRVEADVWRAYRAVCAWERLGPSRPIEEFLRLVLEGDSALSLLCLMREAATSKVGGYEAYARVLLDWYINGKFWISGADEDVSVELLLLESLKAIVDKGLRLRIEEALISRQRSINAEKKA